MLSRPLTTNSKSVFRFSGDGLVTKMLEYPRASAPEMARPRAADLPLPLAAVSATVDLRVFSEAESRKVTRDFAWSRVLQSDTSVPAGWVSAKVSQSSPSSLGLPLGSPPAEDSPAAGLIFAMRLEVGRTLSSSSISTQFGLCAIDRTILSLNRPTTSWWLWVRSLWCTSMERLYNCVREVSVLSSSTIIPPPSTVSIVLARRLGLIASKSCRTHIPYVFPNMFCDSE
mmetsp:Transcript_6623/g.23852  ORF Transcript_6623/g.23852 Transcript_6623/m.23852 type:complete len:228 (+) Transcript_6623:2187-2870(+)